MINGSTKKRHYISDSRNINTTTVKATDNLLLKNVPKIFK